MKRLLITGGAGFIGSHFVEYWLNNHPKDRVVVLDLLTYAGNRDFLAPFEPDERFRFVQGDICKESLVDKLLREEEVDTIVHFAAESHVDRSISAPDVFIQTNIIGTHTLLKLARQIWIEEGLCVNDHRFHHISTDEVYGSLKPEDPAFTEKTPYAPNSPYSASKAASDHLVRAYQNTYGLNTSISNCSNNFGANQHSEKLLPAIILNLLHGKPIPIYGDGQNIRDWLHVEDHCKGIDIILDKGVVGETYNIGGDNEWDNLSLCKKVCSLVNKLFREDSSLMRAFPACPASKGVSCDSLIEFVTDRPGHDRRYAINASKLHSLAPLTPLPFEQRLSELILHHSQQASTI